MDEWPVVTFSELIDRGVLEIGDAYRAKNDELGGDGPIFLRAGLVQDDGIDLSKAERFLAERVPAVAGKMSRPGDVLVTTKGNSTGRTAFISGSLPTVVYSPHLSYWRSKRSDVLAPGYLRYWSQSEYFRRQLAGMAASTDMAPYLSLSDQRRLRIEVPPIDVQRNAARILGALDDKIELNHQLAERLDGAARAIFQGWFIENPAAAIWPVASLADVFEVNPSRPLTRTAPAPYLDMANMPTRGPSALGVAMRIPGSGARFENGDTLLARITPCLENGKTALVDFLPPGERGWGSTEYIVLRPREPLPEPFAYCLARQPEFVTYAAARMNGSSGRQRVSAAAISEFEIRTPPPELATRFGIVVDPMFDRIAVARRESRTLVALRDALLPRLLSGEASPSFGRGHGT